MKYRISNRLKLETLIRICVLYKIKEISYNNICKKHYCIYRTYWLHQISTIKLK